MESSLTVVIPKSMADQAIYLCHDVLDGGHVGRRRAWDEVKKAFYWHGMGKDVENYLDKCPQCNAKKPMNHKEGLIQQPERATRFFQRVGIDLIEHTQTPRGNRVAIVAIDHYTKYAFAKALKKGSAAEVMDFILNDLYFIHGAMEELWSDNGAVFVGETLDWVEKSGGVKRVLTTTYHPQTNGQTERMNQVLVNTLSKYIDKNQSDWDTLLPATLWMYNTSTHETTGIAPHKMLTGREPRKTIHSVLLAGHNAEGKTEWKAREQMFRFWGGQSRIDNRTVNAAEQRDKGAICRRGETLRGRCFSVRGNM